MYDTTGQIVMCSGDTAAETLIAQDNGHYEGTVEAMNVRRLKTIVVLNLGVSDPVIRDIVLGRPGYGCGYGGNTGKLFPLTDTDFAALLKAESEKHSDQKQRDEAAHDNARPEWVSPRGKTLAEEMESADSIY